MCPDVQLASWRTRTWLRFPVGQRYSYSNLGVDLAGYILQVRSGMPFHQYVKQKLLDPIGMTASSFDMDYIKRMARRAIGHSLLPKEVVGVPMIPSGGLYTNARELARYVQFHLNGGKVNGAQLINDQLLRQMYQIPLRSRGKPMDMGWAWRLGVTTERCV